MALPDLSLYVPVICETNSKYAGKCYMEKISAVRTLNGESVPKETTLKKADFKTGDVVTIRFQNKDFRGTIDFSRDEEVLHERGESPSSSSRTPTKASSPVVSTVSALPPASEQKRKRHRSWDGHAALSKRGKKSPAKSSTAKEARNDAGRRSRGPSKGTGDFSAQI